MVRHLGRMNISGMMSFRGHNWRLFGIKRFFGLFNGRFRTAFRKKNVTWGYFLCLRAQDGKTGGGRDLRNPLRQAYYRFRAWDTSWS